MWFSLDASNRIIALSPNWEDRAQQIAGAPVRLQAIVGRSLWDFVSGSETRSYLNALFFWSRQSGRGLALPYRCDAPGLRRDCQMLLAPQGEGGVEVRHELLSETRIDGHFQLSPGSAARQCSQCLRWESPEGWYDRTLSVPVRDLFIRYVICPDCRQRATRALDRGGAGG